MRLRCVLLRHIAKHAILKCIVAHADKVDDVCSQCIELADCIGVCDFCADNLSAIPVYLGNGSNIYCIFDTVDTIDLSKVASILLFSRKVPLVILAWFDIGDYLLA